jgi:hypothetical protein
MIGAPARIPVMTLLKLLATAMVALTFLAIASPGFAANDGSGVTNGTPPNDNAQDPAAKPRRHHHKHRSDGQQHPRRPRNQNPDQGSGGGTGQG